MLRKLAAVLLATTLIAGPAFAAQPSGDAPAAAAQSSGGAATKSVTNQVKPTKTVKHVRKHTRKHLARGKTGHKTGQKQARHVKPMKTHGSSVSHNVKPGSKSNKSST